MAVTPGKALPPGEEFHRLRLRVGTAQTISVVKSGDARCPELGRFGVGQPVRDIIIVERDLERREHVDDERRGDKIDRAARVAFPRRRGEGIGAPVDHGRS